MPPALVRLLVNALSRLPLPALRMIGSAVGWLLSVVPNRERRTAQVNLALSFPELGEASRDDLLRRTLIANATTMLEMPYAWIRPPQTLLGMIDDQGLAAAMSRLRKGGNGLILAAPHLGNWEIGVHFLAAQGPLTVLYRPPRQSVLEPFMVGGRGRDYAQLVPTTRAGIQSLFRALKRGEMVAILPDQAPKPESGSAGVFAPFFGTPALTMTLISRLAARTGAPVLMVYGIRGPDGRFRTFGLEAPADVANADPVVAATALNRAVEQCVRAAPEQYQWTYQRFKAQPAGRRNPYVAAAAPTDR